MSKKLLAIASTMNECYESRNQFINEFAYQYGHTGKDAIFTNGNDYFAISKSAPKTVVGKEWKPHIDQFWAKDLGLTVWVSKQEGDV